MKVKFIKKMLAILCAATMSMSCVADSVGAIEFVKGFEGVDVEGTQKYVSQTNKTIQEFKNKLHRFKDLVDAQLGEYKPTEQEIAQLKQQQELKTLQIKNQKIEKQKLKEKEDAFKREESSLNSKLSELQQEQNMIYKMKHDYDQQKNLSMKSDLKKRIETETINFNSKYDEFKKHLKEYGYVVKTAYTSPSIDSNLPDSVEFKIAPINQMYEEPIKTIDIKLEEYVNAKREQNPDRIKLFKSVQEQIGKCISLIEKLDKIKFIKAVNLKDCFLASLFFNSPIDKLTVELETDNFNEDGLQCLTNNYAALCDGISIYLNEYLVLKNEKEPEKERLEKIEKEEKEKKKKENKKKIKRKKIKRKESQKANEGNDRAQKFDEEKDERERQKKERLEEIKELDKLSNQIEMLSKELPEATKATAIRVNDYNIELSKMNHNLLEAYKSVVRYKSAVRNEEFNFYQAEAEKAIEQAAQIEDERSKLKKKMEKDITDLKKQKEYKEKLEKQYESIMVRIRTKERFKNKIEYIKREIKDKQDNYSRSNAMNSFWTKLKSDIENIENKLKNERFKDSNKLEEYEKQIDDILKKMSEEEERERQEKERQEKERQERERKEQEERERQERERLEKIEKEKKEPEKKKKVVKKVEQTNKNQEQEKKEPEKKKTVMVKKSIRDKLYGLLDQIEVLSKDIQQAETEKTIKQKDLEKSELKEKMEKDIADLEKSELKEKMEKDIADLEKQIKDKTFEKANLKKQYQSIMARIRKKERIRERIAYIKGRIKDKQNNKFRYQNSRSNAGNSFLADLSSALFLAKLKNAIENIENELKNERFKDSNKLEKYENKIEEYEKQIDNILKKMSK